MAETIGIIIIGIIALVLISLLIMISMWYKKPTPGKAIIRTGSGGLKVEFNLGMFAIPTLHKLTEIDISIKELDIEFLGNNALISKDGERVEMVGKFISRINLDAMDIMIAVQTLGVERINNIDQFNSFFKSKFTDAVLVSSRGFDGTELVNSPEKFKQTILSIIEINLNGVVLDDLIISKLSKVTL